MGGPSAKDLFLEALDQEEAEQSAFLDERCGDDDALRRRVAHGDADTRLSVGGLASPAGVAATLRRRGGGLALGDRIDDYQLDAQVGEGGLWVDPCGNR